MNENEVNVFQCDLNDSNLFNCILEEVGEKDIDTLTTSTPSLSNKTFINCLNASLVNCLRNYKQELDFPQVQLKTIKNEEGEWLIKEINIIGDKQFNDDLINQRINQCLKFVRRACNLDDSIQLSIIESEIKEELKYYKIQLTKINDLLEDIRDDKSKKEKLFALFNNMAFDKNG
ncbi:MAG: hypothetical protein ACFE9S_15995 [Candidatus Hermodarchaeota archaeon]